VLSCGSIRQGPPAAPEPGVPKMSAALAGAPPVTIGSGKSMHIPLHWGGGMLLPPKPPRPVAFPLPPLPVGVAIGLTPAQPSASANEAIIEPSSRARFIALLQTTRGALRPPERAARLVLRAAY
jgi:hypothetical protein